MSLFAILSAVPAVLRVKDTTIEQVPDWRFTLALVPATSNGTEAGIFDSAALQSAGSGAAGALGADTGGGLQLRDHISRFQATWRADWWTYVVLPAAGQVTSRAVGAPKANP